MLKARDSVYVLCKEMSWKNPKAGISITYIVPFLNVLNRSPVDKQQGTAFFCFVMSSLSNVF